MQKILLSSCTPYLTRHRSRLNTFEFSPIRKLIFDMTQSPPKKNVIEIDTTKKNIK